MFKSFDLEYQSLISNLVDDSDTKRELTVSSGVTGGHPHSGFRIGFVVPGFQNSGTIYSWL